MYRISQNKYDVAYMAINGHVQATKISKYILYVVRIDVTIYIIKISHVCMHMVMTVGLNSGIK